MWGVMPNLYMLPPKSQQCQIHIGVNPRLISLCWDPRVGTGSPESLPFCLWILPGAGREDDDAVPATIKVQQGGGGFAVVLQEVGSESTGW